MSQLWALVLAQLQHQGDKVLVTDAETGTSLTAQSLLAEVGWRTMYVCGKSTRRSSHVKSPNRSLWQVSATAQQLQQQIGVHQAPPGRAAPADDRPRPDAAALQHTRNAQSASGDGNAGVSNGSQHAPQAAAASQHGAASAAPAVAVESATESLQPDSTVGILMDPSPEYIVALLTCVATGCACAECSNYPAVPQAACSE